MNGTAKMLLEEKNTKGLTRERTLQTEHSKNTKKALRP